MKNNIFSDIPESISAELTETIAGNRAVRIERIVSQGHASRDDFWYDQEQNEFVLLLSGEAKLLFETERRIMHMKAGDYVIIPAHKRHRVEWTAPGEKTIWLAVYY
jgi:cupin 2 domain-containing protein